MPVRACCDMCWVPCDLVASGLVLSRLRAKDLQGAEIHSLVGRGKLAVSYHDSHVKKAFLLKCTHV